MRVMALCFSPDGRRLAVVGVGIPTGDLVQPGIAQVWDIASDKWPCGWAGERRRPSSAVADVALAPTVAVWRQPVGMKR